MLGMVPPNVLGVNFVTETLKVSSVPVGLESVIVTEVGWPIVTLPKLAETGSSHVVASAATERFSRPAPCAVGPTSCKPSTASLITKSARVPATRGVDIDVPLKKAHPVPSPGHVSGLPTQVIELRTLTPTDVRSGLTARSTFVGPRLRDPARMSLLGVMNSWTVAMADASGGLAARSAAPSSLPIMTAGKLSPPPPSLAIATGSPATLLITTTPIAPAAIALRTFVLTVAPPRLTTTTLPEAPGSTLVQAVSSVLKYRPNEAVGNGGKSPTAAPTVVPPLAG